MRLPLPCKVEDVFISRSSSEQSTPLRKHLYLSDLLPCSFIGLQLIQDRLGVLQHHIHLFPHLSLRFCGLRICKGQHQGGQHNNIIPVFLFISTSTPWPVINDNRNLSGRKVLINFSPIMQMKVSRNNLILIPPIFQAERQETEGDKTRQMDSCTPCGSEHRAEC